MTTPVGGSSQMGGAWSLMPPEEELSTVGSSQDVGALGDTTQSFTSEGSRAASPPSPLIPTNPLGRGLGLLSQDEKGRLRTSASVSPPPPATPPSTPQGGPLDPSEYEQAKMAQELRKLGMGQSVVHNSHDDFSAISPETDLKGE